MSKEQDRPTQPLTLADITRLAIETTLRDGKHIPTLIAQGNKGTSVVQVRNVPPTPEARRAQMFLLGHSLAQERSVGGLRQVFFITEAWMSVGTAEELPDLPPSQDPKHKEILLISGYKPITRQVEAVTIEMLRNSEGKLTELKPLEQLTGTEVTSPLLIAFAEGFRRGAI